MPLQDKNLVGLFGLQSLRGVEKKGREMLTEMHDNSGWFYFIKEMGRACTSPGGRSEPLL